jgi:hypothetical protein
MRHLRRHANGLPQRRIRVNRLADVHGIGTHLNGQGNLADHVARMGADHATAQNLAPACGMAMGLGAVIKQQLGDAFVTAIGDGSARRSPGEQALFHLDDLRLGLVFGQADPGHLPQTSRLLHKTQIALVLFSAVNRVAKEVTRVMESRCVFRSGAITQQRLSSPWNLVRSQQIESQVGF